MLTVVRLLANAVLRPPVSHSISLNSFTLSLYTLSPPFSNHQFLPTLYVATFLSFSRTRALNKRRRGRRKRREEQRGGGRVKTRGEREKQVTPECVSEIYVYALKIKRYVCARACVCMSVCVRVRACVCVCVRVCVCYICTWDCVYVVSKNFGVYVYNVV